MTVAIIILLVSMSGLFSGLTLGLLGLNKDELERKMKLGNEEIINREIVDETDIHENMREITN